MLRRVLRLARMLCALMYRQNGDLANLLKSARKKVPQSARLSAGGGCNRYLGNAQIEVTLISVGLPLRTYQLTWVGARDTCVSKNIQRLYFSDFGYCCRIYPRLELGNEPSMLLPSDSDSPGWVKDEYSESIFYVQF